MRHALKLCAAVTALAFAFDLALPQPALAQSAQCPDPVTAKAEVEQTIHDFFDALRGEGEVPFDELTTPMMYSFDVGQSFEGDTLAKVVIEALADGVEINWNLGPMDTKVRCDVAWSAWKNTGSAGVPPEVRPVSWLESAVLVHDGERWRIDFFHSQRAAGD